MKQSPDNKNETNDGESRTESPQPENRAPRVGVYICHCGGNISDVVDVKKAVEAASQLPNVAVARDYSAICSQIGQDLIVDDIHREGLNRIVVAACSPSLHETTFRSACARAGGNPYQYEHVNIREQVSWCSKAHADAATLKATNLVAAGVAKVTLAQPLKPIDIAARQHAVVVGGGISGLRTALDLARTGLDVALVERSPWLGGHVVRWHRLYNTDADPRELVESLMAEVMDHPRISIHLRAEITGTTGYLGNFHIQLRLQPRGVEDDLAVDRLQQAIEVCPVEVPSEQAFDLVTRKAIMRAPMGCQPHAGAIDWEHCSRCGKCVEAVDHLGISLDNQPEEITIDTGAIVLATGFDLYEPSQGEFGYGEFSNVVTLAQLECMLDPRGPTGGKLQRDGQQVNSVCMIHCVGSRQIEGVHKPGPDGKLRDYCSRVCCSATLRAAAEIRDRFPATHVFELYRDIRSYARGQEANYEDTAKKGVIFIRYPDETPPSVTAAPDGSGAALMVRAEDGLTFGEELDIPADLVVLATGMGAGPVDQIVDMLKLPRSTDGFLQEVHPKLRPVEMAVSGVFIAGTCQAPMDITESCAAGSAAAAKVVSLLGQGQIQLDPYRAQVDLDRCQGEGKCVEACAHQKAVTLVDMEIDGQRVKRAQVNSALCTGCGMCVPVCPHGAIQVAGWHLEQFDAMVDALTAVH